MAQLFHFEETVFAAKEWIEQTGNSDAEEKEQISNIHLCNPEISHRGELAIGNAIGDYSRAILAVIWADWVRDRDTGLIGYIYIGQLYPGFNFGSTGLYCMDLLDYSDTLSWVNSFPCPEWISREINEKITK